MTGPLDETLPPIRGDLLAEPHLTPGEEHPAESAQQWAMLRRWRNDLTRRASTAPTSGPEAWRHVEELLDLALAERAQRTVDRIIARRTCPDADRTGRRAAPAGPAPQPD